MTARQALRMVGAKRMVVGHTPQMNGCNCECDGQVRRFGVRGLGLIGRAYSLATLNLGSQPPEPGTRNGNMCGIAASLSVRFRALRFRSSLTGVAHRRRPVQGGHGGAAAGPSCPRAPPFPYSMGPRFPPCHAPLILTMLPVALMKKA